METKFKVGDRVRQRKDSQFYHQSEEKVGEITEDQGDGWFIVKWKGNGSRNGYMSKHLELATKGRGRPKKEKPPLPVKFALQYDLDKDPTEYFTSLKDAKKRILELPRYSTLKRDSIRLHTIKKTQVVTLGVSIAIK